MLAEIGEDNTSTIAAVRKGYSPHLRHLLRMQRVSLGSLHDLITEDPPQGSGEIVLLHRETKTHKGDVFTKPLPPAEFLPAIARLGMRQARLPRPHKKGCQCAVGRLMLRPRREGHCPSCRARACRPLLSTREHRSAPPGLPRPPRGGTMLVAWVPPMSVRLSRRVPSR